MLCENCGENEASVRYTQIINGVKKEMILCDECSKELGVEKMDFSMPINLSSFLGDFFEDLDENFLPEITKTKKVVCEECGMTYDEFTHTGKFGCANCYDAFGDRTKQILKNLQGADTHVGRKTKITKTDLNKIQEKKQNENNEINQIETLKQKLKQAIKEERYEDAAKIRDEIKKIQP